MPYSIPELASSVDPVYYRSPVDSDPQYLNNNCSGYGHPEIGQAQYVCFPSSYTDDLTPICKYRYLTPYHTSNAFSPPSSAGSDVVFNTPNWSRSNLTSTSKMSTPSLSFDSYSSSSSASYSPSNHGHRRSLTSSRHPFPQAPTLPYQDTARSTSRPPTRRGSVTSATPYDRQGHASTYGEEASAVRTRRRQSIATEKDKERERARAKVHRENEQRVLMELSKRLPPPTLCRKRSRIDVMTDGTSLNARSPHIIAPSSGSSDFGSLFTATMLIDDLRDKNERFERGHRATQSAQEYKFVHHGQYF